MCFLFIIAIVDGSFFLLYFLVAVCIGFMQWQHIMAIISPKNLGKQLKNEKKTHLLWNAEFKFVPSYASGSHTVCYCALPCNNVSIVFFSSLFIRWNRLDEYGRSGRLWLTIFMGIANSRVRTEAINENKQRKTGKRVNWFPLRAETSFFVSLNSFLVLLLTQVTQFFKLAQSLSLSLSLWVKNLFAAFVLSENSNPTRENWSQTKQTMCFLSFSLCMCVCVCERAFVCLIVFSVHLSTFGIKIANFTISTQKSN